MMYLYVDNYLRLLNYRFYAVNFTNSLRFQRASNSD